ncbi:hypothetical protein shim_10370 [Shimia sp. SK013]|uniref:hypothetical protein n=1 Tax=Shimia sp. SK013 TaxID=1389006 RepID=UPI0006CC3325|nr:hypothetical protein [Shimia sp. SK013]KPA22749.1 hypothetical protein shim_10370 [Shimia sp. SK013]
MSARPTEGSETRQTTLRRAEALAERVTASMQAQGYQEIEYVLTECHLKIVASAPGTSARTQYLILPTASTTFGGHVALGPNPKLSGRRFIL